MTFTPQAFISYAHSDNDFFRGKITELSKRLREAYRTANGSDLNLFIDENGIRWGEQWRDKLETALGASLFLIPIVTPSFLESKECRKEFECFLRLEDQSARNDRILPLLFVDAWQLDDEKRRQTDEIVRELRKRQWRDWRKLATVDRTDDRALTEELLNLGAVLGKAVRSYSVLSVITGTAPPSRGESPGLLLALNEAVQDALGRIHIASASRDAQEILTEAAKLAPEPGYDQEISLSRVFCGALVAGVRLNVSESNRMLRSLANVMQTPSWRVTREKNLARFHYDTIEDAISRLKRGFSLSAIAGLKAARDGANNELTGDGVVTALLNPAPGYDGSLLYGWIGHRDLWNEVNTLSLK